MKEPLVPECSALRLLLAMVLSIPVVPLCDPVLSTGEVILAGLKPLVTELVADWHIGQSTVVL